MRQREHDLQAACVRYFRYRHPRLSLWLEEAANADLLLLVPDRLHHGLCIEMKTPEGRQSAAQSRWQRAVEQMGYRYAICRSLGQFIELVEGYLSDK